MKSVCCDETQIVFTSSDEDTDYIQSLRGELEKSAFSPLNSQQLTSVGEALADASCTLASVEIMLTQKECRAFIYDIPMSKLGILMSNVANMIEWELKAREELRASESALYHDLYSRYNVDYLG